MKNKCSKVISQSSFFILMMFVLSPLVHGQYERTAKNLKPIGWEEWKAGDLCTRPLDREGWSNELTFTISDLKYEFHEYKGYKVVEATVLDADGYHLCTIKNQWTARNLELALLFQCGQFGVIIDKHANGFFRKSPFRFRFYQMSEDSLDLAKERISLVNEEQTNNKHYVEQAFLVDAHACINESEAVDVLEANSDREDQSMLERIYYSDFGKIPVQYPK
jgi:hypothetical protein